MRPAFGRLPWFALFFLRVRRLRPFLAMRILLSCNFGSSFLAQLPRQGAKEAPVLLLGNLL